MIKLYDFCFKKPVLYKNVSSLKCKVLLKINLKLYSNINCIMRTENCAINIFLEVVNDGFSSKCLLFIINYKYVGG